MERIENAKISQLASEIELILPVELTVAQSIELAHDYAKKHEHERKRAGARADAVEGYFAVINSAAGFIPPRPVCMSVIQRRAVFPLLRELIQYPQQFRQ